MQHWQQSNGNLLLSSTKSRTRSAAIVKHFAPSIRMRDASGSSGQL